MREAHVTWFSHFMCPKSLEDLFSSGRLRDNVPLFFRNVYCDKISITEILSKYQLIRMPNQLLIDGFQGILAEIMTFYFRSHLVVL